MKLTIHERAEEIWLCPGEEKVQIHAIELGLKKILLDAAEELEAMSSEITPSLGTANGAMMKQMIVSWLREKVSD